ncbi:MULTISPECIES: phage tail protein [Nostoc]|uniref:Phage tail protein n=2 Tax=Nostoc TaxID=1177 RepID=A0ABR8IHM0_9NOSO|nr:MULTISPECIES: phage tail protein [Nostoc]MBD2563970.1 phage tail protein [Nostoc linckia FACHB-391]MBD2650442.1 phage tail protein [Nostoc foliaceum FACHB-393]
MPRDQKIYPIPVFHFSVDWGGDARGEYSAGFSEVTGLTREIQVIEYRDGIIPEYSPIKVVGLHKYTNVMMKRGIVLSDNDFYKWVETTLLLNKVERRDLTIKLLDETHSPVMWWNVLRAFPVKLEGPQLKASGNEVAIESIEIAHEGIEVKIK